MKKHIYLLLPLLTPTPSMALTFNPILGIQKAFLSLLLEKRTIIASTLVLSHSSYDKKRSLDLYQAVEQNNITDALQLINNPQVDINAKVDYGTNAWDNGGCTPLIFCALKGDESLKIAQGLLKRKDINVNLQDKDGCTPLIWCAFAGDGALPIAQALLKHQDINVNLQNTLGWTPLIQCAENGDGALDIAHALLGHNEINVNLQNNKGTTPLDKIIEQIQATKKDNWMMTPYKYVQLWNLLVAQGALLNKQNKAYHHLNPNHFQEPQKSHVQAIKNNPPKNWHQ